MTKTLTETSTYGSSVVVPEGGDLRRAASIETPLQTLANRTKYLQQLTEAIGVKRLRTVTDPGDAMLFTDLVQGDVVLIANHGLYRFQQTLSFPDSIDETAAANWTYEVLSGGYLVHTGVDVFFRTDKRYCLVSTDGTGKLLAPDVVPNRTVCDVITHEYVDQLITGNGVSWYDVFYCTLTDLSEGDRVYANCTIFAYGSSSDVNNCSMRLAFQDGSTVTQLNGGFVRFSCASGKFVPVAVSGYLPVPSNVSTATILLQTAFSGQITLYTRVLRAQALRA